MIAEDDFDFSLDGVVTKITRFSFRNYDGIIESLNEIVGITAWRSIKIKNDQQSDI